MRERGTPRCFAEVLESCHSPLVLVGAPAQGSCSPLIRTRIKCSLRDNSLTLCRGESPTTAHKLDMSHPQEHQVIFMPPITTEPSRWLRSPRVTSNELSLDPNKDKESGGCTFEHHKVFLSWTNGQESYLGRGGEVYIHPIKSKSRAHKINRFLVHLTLLMLHRTLA